MPLIRITITIPEELVAQADRRARELGRSRSWVMVEALRRDLHAPGAVREEVTHPYATSVPGLGAQRTAQLEADLRLTPEERVKEAERTLRVSELLRPSTQRSRVITFDTYEDYLRWADREALER